MRMFPARSVLGGPLNPLRGILAEIQGLQILTLRGIQQKASACTQALCRAGGGGYLNQINKKHKKHPNFIPELPSKNKT